MVTEKSGSKSDNVNDKLNRRSGSQQGGLLVESTASKPKG